LTVVRLYFRYSNNTVFLLELRVVANYRPQKAESTRCFFSSLLDR